MTDLYASQTDVNTPNLTSDTSVVKKRGRPRKLLDKTSDTKSIQPVSSVAFEAKQSAQDTSQSTVSAPQIPKSSAQTVSDSEQNYILSSTASEEAPVSELAVRNKFYEHAERDHSGNNRQGYFQRPRPQHTPKYFEPGNPESKDSTFKNDKPKFKFRPGEHVNHGSQGAGGAHTHKPFNKNHNHKRPHPGQQPQNFQPKKFAPQPHKQPNIQTPHNPNFNKSKRFEPKSQSTHKSKAHAANWGTVPNWEVLKSFDRIQAYYESKRTDDQTTFDIDTIYQLSFKELAACVAALDTTISVQHLSRTELVQKAVRIAAQKESLITISGILELLDGGGGCLVYAHDNYHVTQLSAYISEVLIKQYNLKKGHCIKALIDLAPDAENVLFVHHIESIMEEAPESQKAVVPFADLIAYYPLDRILLETADKDAKGENVSMRILDLLTPIGLGQRALIVAPPRTGKTILMQEIAKSIRISQPDVTLIVLLIDERPEEVTDFKRLLDCEIVSSTFDEPAERHVHVAEMVIEKARCMVESGKDVVILLDSLTRLARAYNAVMPDNGKIMSGGVGANALGQPKRIFGSARNIENGGSLTIIGSILVETNSKMDEVIYEEFKGTGNAEVHLDRALSDKRIFPAINIDKSGTRKEELLYHPEELSKIYSLRRAMKGMPSVDSMEMLVQKVKKTKTNAEFLVGLTR